MSAKLVVAGFVMSGLVSAGAVTVLVVSQPQPVRQVQFVAPAAVEVTPTVAPVVVPATEAPAPVESAQAPVQAAPTSEAPVAVKSPAAVVAKQTVSPPRAAGTYPDGSPFKYDSTGRLLEPLLAPEPGYLGNAPRSDTLNAAPIPTATQP